MQGGRGVVTRKRGENSFSLDPFVLIFSVLGFLVLENFIFFFKTWFSWGFLPFFGTNSGTKSGILGIIRDKVGAFCVFSCLDLMGYFCGGFIYNCFL